MTVAYHLPELGFDYAALEPHLPARIIELHHGKHHLAYVTGANRTLELLGEARAAGDWGQIVGLEKALAFNVSGHLLHSIYWANLSPDGGDKPTGELAAAIDDQFGSLDRFREHMVRCATSVQGSGWAALVWEPIGARLLIEQIDQHQGNAVHGSTPLLVIDVWEHAYYLGYENRRADYVTALFNLVNWADVAARFAPANELALR